MIGEAFELEDPDNLLPNGKAGITLALVERTHDGLIQNTYHNPATTIFQMGSEVILCGIRPSIGGQNMIGEGWKC